MKSTDPNPCIQKAAVSVANVKTMVNNWLGNYQGESSIRETPTLYKQVKKQSGPLLKIAKAAPVKTKKQTQKEAEEIKGSSSKKKTKTDPLNLYLNKKRKID